MELKVQAPSGIDDGLHKGVITNVADRKTKEGYRYIDVTVQFEEGKKIKDSYPEFLSPDSKLGRLLERFGADLMVDHIVNIDSVLLKKTCQFQTIKKGKYSNIVDDSLKPRENE